ncbi:MAG: hypothetical protein CVU13_02360 [Bacteroidetes bacterium HGW-Bacteroidetes-8]|jgi:hypothetical protein|nr:MAG: hypothetical protein CVU13_02360 [Bacteroidetes bacterium HGW-Bacteroidetes-8]
MDKKDEILKDLLFEIDDKSIPHSFARRVSSKIDSERVRRERRDETIQIIVVSLCASALLIFSFIYLNNNYFNLSIEDLRLFNSNLGVKQLLYRVKWIFINDGTLLWYILAANTALLIVIQQFAQNYLYSSGKSVNNS